MHLQQIADAIEDSHLKWLVGEVECDDTDPDPCWNNKDARLIHVRRILSLKEEGPKTESFWIESCDCGGSPLIDRLATQWPTRMEGGLPCVTQDLRWREDINLFVVGSLGTLNIGPDAGNLIRIRRAAQLVANAPPAVEVGCVKLFT
jgi:hypothetical protein